MVLNPPHGYLKLDTNEFMCYPLVKVTKKVES